MIGLDVEVWSQNTRGRNIVSRIAVECPSGRIPEEVAEENGGTLFGCYLSLDAAKQAIKNDPNGRADAL